jgi:acyl-coenzyme A thioesterase PaaI-like protein
MATNELTLHRWRAPEGTIAYDGTVLRRGRTNLVIEVAASDDAGPVAASTMAFTVLPRRDDTPVVDLSSLPPRMALEPDGTAGEPFVDAVGYRVEGDAASLEIEPYVRNSFGALNGGVLAGLAEAAAIGTEPGVARQVTVHYLRQAVAGPVVARRRELGRTGGLTASRVEVVDAGAGERQCAVATILVDRVG